VKPKAITIAEAFVDLKNMDFRSLGDFIGVKLAHREPATEIHDAFAEDYPEAVATALLLAEQDILNLHEIQCVDTAFDKIVEVWRKPDV